MLALEPMLRQFCIPPLIPPLPLLLLRLLQREYLLDGSLLVGFGDVIVLIQVLLYVSAVETDWDERARPS